MGAIRLGHADGKRRRRVVYGRTQGEVREKLEHLRTDHAATPLLLGPPETLDAFLDRWLVAHRVLGRNHDSHQLRDAAAYPRALRRALADARRWQLITANPASEVRPPKVVPPTPNLTRDEISRLLEIAEQEELGELFVMALFSGLRSGELLGLQWEYLDPLTGTLRVLARDVGAGPSPNQRAERGFHQLRKTYATLVAVEPAQVDPRPVAEPSARNDLSSALEPRPIRPTRRSMPEGARRRLLRALRPDSDTIVLDARE